MPLASSEWNTERVDAFRDAFYEFLPYVTINSKETGAATELAPNMYRAQEILYNEIFDALSNDIHNIYVLKSRQLGVSTAIRPLMTFWTGIHPGLIGAMVYNTAFNTGVARREITTTIRNLPSRLRFPTIIEDNRSGLTLSDQQQILFMSAGVKNDKSGGGLGRSIGLNFGHFSEISSWVSEQGLKSLKQSLAETFPDRLFIWESTARGYELWYDEWEAARGDPDGNKCIFLGWWSKDTQELAPKTADFERYGAEPPTPREVKRITAVRSLYGWEITLGQLAWYRKKVDPNQLLDANTVEDSILLQEQPWTEDEAYQMTGSSFFQSDKLTEISAAIKKQPPPQVHMFIPGISFVECQVRQAVMRRDVDLKVWEEPVAQSVYIITGDPAFGHSDRSANSAAQVVRCYADGIDQVAEFASNRIEPHHFAWLLWVLAGYYTSKQDSRARVIIEINGPGEEVWRQFKSVRMQLQQGYLRGRAKEKGIADIYTNVMHYIYQRSDSSHAGHSQQWKTNEQLKIQAFESLRGYMNNDTFHIRSIDLVEEMKSITRDGDSVGAEGSHRDDRAFAAAMAVRCWEDTDRRGLVAGNRTREAERARLSLRIEDQWALWSKNTFNDFMSKKAAARLALARQSIGRRPMPSRGRFGR